jgi:RepB DNA-primase from phage plasmid
MTNIHIPAEQGNDLANHLQPNRADAEAFLSTLDPSAVKWTFQTFDDNKERAKEYKKKHKRGDPKFAAIIHGSLDRRWDELVEFNRRGAGVFTCINETDFRGREIKNIVRVRAVFIDLDGAPFPEKLHVNPTIIVESSPGRWHVYWRVKDCPLGAFESIQKRLAAHYKSDPSIHDLPRVMRIPGFFNHKAAPVCSQLLKAHGDE